jgi:hypothetical protein
MNISRLFGSKQKRHESAYSAYFAGAYDRAVASVPRTTLRRG